ncbi:MAG: VWA domain-containing protein, partial [Propionibacteriaceae bacterium]|nr:VWA domain-containing protein [Propionibacteriaceae bacterium]
MSQPGRHTSRYGRYRGGPDPLAPPVDLAEALEHIGREVMDGTSPERAMREFLRRGTRSQTGLDDLAQQIARKRRQLLQKHRLDGTLEEIRQLLDEAVLAERKQLARDLDDDARFDEMRLENLPPQTAAAVNELRDYDWRSAEAKAAYEKIADLIGRESLDQRFAGMKQALENATDDDRARVNEMLRDLNDLLETHARGEDTDQQFRDFMAKHGEFFPENPQTIDELLDALAERAAAAQRMRNSLSPDQRAELDALASQAFGSPELMESLALLDANLMALRPGEDWDGSEEFRGREGVGFGEAAGLMQDLAELDQLSEQLSQQYAGAALDDIDLDALTRQLGAEAAVDARTLADLERALREHGYLQRGSDNTLRLSPKAMRQLGKALLKDVAERLSGRTGSRDTRTAGAAGERTGSSRAWEFGDTEPWDVTRTVANAVQRTVAEGRDAARGVRLGVDDIEVTETEARTQAAVALLVDTSFSMAIEGRWVPMKRTSLALHHLISTRFRGDAMTVIGFGRTAATLDIAELTALQTNYGIQGTNLHHGLLLANRFFRRHPSAQPVLLIVTDGEPTAHLEPDGEAYFDYP